METVNLTSILSERVRSLREAKGLTQEELGKAIGGSRSTIQNLEYSNRLPNGEVIDQLAHYFKVTSSYLLGYSDDPFVNKKRPLTWFEAEKVYGKLLNPREALKHFSRCGSTTQLRKLIELGYYSDTVLIVGEHLLPRKNGATADDMIYFIQDRVKDGIDTEETFKSIKSLGLLFEMDGKRIKSWYHKGVFDGAPMLVKGSQIYIDQHWFRTNMLNFEAQGLIIPDSYKSLAELARIYKVTRNVLKEWFVAGAFGDNAPVIERMRTVHVEEQWFAANITRIREAQKVKSTLKRVETMGFNYGPEFLFAKPGGEVILAWIDKYAIHKVNGGAVNVGGKITKIKKPAKPERTLTRIREHLIRLCYKIVCGRCSIEEYWKLSNGGGYLLNESEQNQFDPTIFKVTDFNVKDIDHVRKGLKDTVFFDAIEMYLKPFIWFVFSEQKASFRQRKRKFLEAGVQTDDERKEIERLNDLLDLYEDDLQHAFASVPQHRPEVRDENRKLSIHLTREQILLALQNIYSLSFVQDSFSAKGGRGSRGFRDPLKRATCFFMGCQTGIRNDEACNILISDFELNDDGLLQRFEYDPTDEWVTNHLGLVGPSKPTDSLDGYGLLRIRKEVAKGGWGPSPKWGTYLAPTLVTMINAYLTSLYKAAPKSIGKGYFFRTDPMNPNAQHSSTDLTRWISDTKGSIVGFLPDKLLRHFSYYDVRHTVADLILNHTIVEERLKPYLERVGELHIRHDMLNSSSNKSLIKKHYASSAGAHEYFQVLVESNDYPVNLTGDRVNARYKNFYDWEIQKGYRELIVDTPQEPLDSVMEEPVNDVALTLTIQSEALKQLVNIRAEKQAYLDVIAGEYKRQFIKRFGLTEDLWFEEVPKIEKEIAELTSQINQKHREELV
jgi:transcriptional regulator with XRE-family HTH domain/integrase